MTELEAGKGASGLEDARELCACFVLVRAPVEGLSIRQYMGVSRAGSEEDVSRVHTWAMTIKSAQPSSIPVASNVPSRTETRGSVVALEKTSRMPALGSTARSA